MILLHFGDRRSPLSYQACFSSELKPQLLLQLAWFIRGPRLFEQLMMKAVDNSTRHELIFGFKSRIAAGANQVRYNCLA
jgi:hypothetical protein